MHDSSLLIDLAVALGAALAGGVLAKLAGLPVIAGYILAGIAVGPSTPGFVADIDAVRVLADLGVAFLMFSLGVEFSLSELIAVRRVAILGGITQILLTIVAGAGLGLVLGWSWAAAVLLGMTVAVSSSIVALKLLLLRGETGAPHGRVAVGLAIVQDLALVPMLVAMPLLADSGGEVLPTVARSVGIAVAILAAVVVVGTRLAPALLTRIAATSSRELFLLTVIVVALGTALLTEAAGLSLALGAFLAGMVISESDYAHQVIADIIPLREAFATLFFVSIGMLFDLSYAWHNPGNTLLLIAFIVLIKFAIVAVAVRMSGIPTATAVFVGLLLAQIGEFSFILAGEGVDRDMLDSGQYSLILGGAIGTILLTPLGVSAGPRLVALVRRLAPRDRLADGLSDVPHGLARHSIIAGYGRLGEQLAGVLGRRGFACIVIDSDPSAVRRARDAGLAAVYGDAGNPEVLRRVGIGRARVLAVAISDPLAAEAAVRFAKAENARLRVVARATGWEQLHRLLELGADEVVQPEFEASLELVRYALHALGVDGLQVAGIVQGRRSAYYDQEPRSAVP